MLLPRQDLLKYSSRAFPTLLADFYWLRTIQQAGIARTAEEYRDAAALADLVTVLDPDFEYPYFFGGAIAPVNLGRERWMNIKESTALLERGLERFPDNLQMRILLAYNVSQFDKDYLRAARLLEEATKRPGSPPYLKRLVTRLYTHSGNFDVALDLAATLAEEAPDEGSRQLFEQRRKEVVLERTLQEVEAAAKRFANSEGRLPLNVIELVAAGHLERMPEDPFGGEIVLRNGVASTTAGVQRLQIFDPQER